MFNLGFRGHRLQAQGLAIQGHGETLAGLDQGEESGLQSEGRGGMSCLNGFSATEMEHS